MESGFSIISTAILLLFVLDPFGNVPLLLSILKNVDQKRHKAIIVREMLIGLFILLVFLFFGERFFYQLLYSCVVILFDESGMLSAGDDLPVFVKQGG